MQSTQTIILLSQYPSEPFDLHSLHIFYFINVTSILYL